MKDGATREEVIAHASEDLARKFAGIFGPETIRQLVTESLDALAHARVQAFVPLFVNRFARERLKAAAQAQGAMMPEIPEVLFVCVHNAGRSQMAAALLDRAAGGRVHVRSAGSTPAGDLHAGVREAMSEIGIDLSKEFPKPLTDEVIRAADVVITMGCGDACPVLPGRRYLDWDAQDPAGKFIEEVRRIRDDIDKRVQALVKELSPAST